MNDTSKHFVGIDLHRAILQVFVLDAEGEIVKERHFHGASIEEGFTVVE